LFGTIRFNSLENDMEDIEEWVATFFGQMMNTCNAFFATLPLAEAIERIELIPWAELVREQLQGQDQEIIEFATERITELKEMELAHYRAYLDLE
jgi:hypothetical protein